MQNNPLNFVDPSGFEGGPIQIDIQMDMAAGGTGAAKGGQGAHGGSSASQSATSQTQTSSTSWTTGTSTNANGQTITGITMTTASGGGTSSTANDQSGGNPNMDGRSSPTQHGGSHGADFQAPGNQSAMSMPQPVNTCGPAYNSSGNNSPSAAGGVQSYAPSAQPAAGSSGRTDGNMQGNSATGMPTPYMDSSPEWLKEAATMTLMMCMTPAAKLVLEGFGAGTEVAVLGRGSTAAIEKGSTLARTLRESLAIRQVIANPEAGRQLRSIAMNDARWLAREGWVKMQQVVNSGGREGAINVHYVYNTITGAIDDLKIIVLGAR